MQPPYKTTPPGRSSDGGKATRPLMEGWQKELVVLLSVHRLLILLLLEDGSILHGKKSRRLESSSTE